MHEKAVNKQLFSLFLTALALGYFVGRGRRAPTLEEIADYQQDARDARRTANSLRWELEQRRKQHGG